MFWNNKKKNVFTEFIDSVTGKIIANSNMPVDQIPDSFEINTTLDMPDGKYFVVEATPKLKIDFIKTGKLKVVLRKVELINPKDIMYTMPTIENAFFDSEDIKDKDNYFLIHEDDWRQSELISAAFLNDINSELTEISKIYQNNMEGNFFKTVHVRNMIPSPLSGIAVELNDLMAFFEVSTKYKGFGLGMNSPWGSIAKNGFSFKTANDTDVFGILNKENKLEVICFKHFDGDVKNILSFCKKYNLVFLDWVKALIVNDL